MPDSKLVDLDAASALDGTELLYAVQDGLDVKVLASSFLATAVNRIISNTTLDATYNQVFCNTDGGTFTITLPVTPANGQYYRIINTGSNDLTIDENGKSLLGSIEAYILSASEALIITYEDTEGWW